MKEIVPNKNSIHYALARCLTCGSLEQCEAEKWECSNNRITCDKFAPLDTRFK